MALDHFHRFHLSVDTPRKKKNNMFVNSRRSFKAPEIYMLLINKYGRNFKPGVSLFKDLRVKVTEMVDYEQSLFRLVRRAWRERKPREKNGRANS